MNRTVICDGAFGAGESLADHLPAEHAANAADFARTFETVAAVVLHVEQGEQAAHQLLGCWIVVFGHLAAMDRLAVYVNGMVSACAAQPAEQPPGDGLGAIGGRPAAGRAGLQAGLAQQAVECARISLGKGPFGAPRDRQ